MDKRCSSSEIIREREHYNRIVSRSGGSIGTAVTKLQFLDDYVERQVEIDSGKRVRSNTSPRLLIPKKWFRKKSKGKETKYWEDSSSTSSSS